MAPSALTGTLAIHGGLSPQPWLIVADILGPLVGFVLGLLSYVVAARIERNSLIASTLARSAADGVRMALRGAAPLEADQTIEVSVTHVPNGFKAIVSRARKPPILAR